MSNIIERTIIFPEPPTYYDIVAKEKKVVIEDKRTGKKRLELKKDRHYLTANLYYAQVHFSVRSKVINYAKDYILLWLPILPKLRKCRLKFIYYRPKNKTSWDLDNKLSFWAKAFIDVLKVPSPKEIKKSKDKNYKIKTISVIQDDSVKYIDEIIFRYREGPEKLVVELYAITLEEQQTLF